MPQYLQLPDGSSLKLRDGESAEQAMARAQQTYPEAFGGQKPPAKSSVAADLGYSALSGLGSLVQFPGQVYGLATGNMDNSVSNIGQSIQDYARANQSEGLKQKQQAQHEAIQAASKDGFLSEAGTAASTTL